MAIFYQSKNIQILLRLHPVETLYTKKGSSSVIDLIKDDYTSWESNPLNNLSKNNELYAFKHNGFWQPMDTLRDKNYLESLYLNKAPWKKWK